MNLPYPIEPGPVDWHRDDFGGHVYASADGSCVGDAHTASEARDE